MLWHSLSDILNCLSLTKSDIYTIGSFLYNIAVGGLSTGTEIFVCINLKLVRYQYFIINTVNIIKQNQTEWTPKFQSSGEFTGAKEKS